MSDQDESEAQMAALMGFSTFGASKPKKRKFNSATDAFVDGQELEKLDRGGKKGKGSGGNSAPLGKRRALGEKSGGESMGRKNDDELDLGLDDNDEDGGDGGVPILTNLPRPTGKISPPRTPNSSDEGEGPNYVDTSMPPPLLADSHPDQDPTPQTEEQRQMQEKIDSILDSIQPPPSSTIEPPSFSPPRNRNTGFAPMAHQHHDLPARPLPNPASGPPPTPTANVPGMSGGGARGGRGGAHRRGGGNHGGKERNEKWWEGYYDPSFNENPWGCWRKRKV
ncbi:hypothetical protein B0J14DRAFT_700954 [Halenospora varia]|nr:hypothetical protein B0J14DRAFT_700954 [Halenospora varia]